MGRETGNVMNNPYGIKFHLVCFCLGMTLGVASVAMFRFAPGPLSIVAALTAGAALAKLWCLSD